MSKTVRLLNYIPNSEGSGATIMLYGDVGQWDDVNSQRVVTELLELESKYSSIDVRINSNGGDVFSGIAIFNALRQSKSDIKIYIDGIAASIAGVIALCGKPLYMSRYSRLMLHRVSGGAYGSAKDLRETADLIEQLELSLSEMIAEKTKLSKEDVYHKYFEDGQDHWLTASTALNLGMIDGIHDLSDTLELSESSTTDEIYKVFNNRLENEAKTTTIDMALIDEIKTIPCFAKANEGNVVSLLREQATKLEAKEQALSALQAKIAELEAKELEGIVNAAITDGRIVEAQKSTFLNLLKNDRENTEALLASLTKQPPHAGPRNSAKQFTQPRGGATNAFQAKSWKELDEAGLLAAYKEDPDGFANAYKQEFGVEYRF